MHLFPKVKNPLSFHITRWHGLPWGIFRIMWMITFFPWDDSAALLKLLVQLFVLRTLQHSLGFYYLVDVDYRLLSLLAILHEVLQSVCNSQWGSVSSWCNRPVCWNKHCQRFLVNHVELWSCDEYRYKAVCSLTSISTSVKLALHFILNIFKSLYVGNSSWGSECCMHRRRMVDVYNASNNKWVRTKTLVKNCLCLLTAYSQTVLWVPLGTARCHKKSAKLTFEEEKNFSKKW